MFRFLLFVIVVGGIALYFTNPSTDEVRASLGGQVPAALASAAPTVPGAPAMPAAPDAPAMPAPPAAAPDVPAAPPADASAAPPAMPSAADAMQGEMQLDRKDYYVFSVYKISVGGQQLPGCVIGIAKHAIPYGSC